MRFVIALLLLAMPAVVHAQNPLPPAVPLPTVPGQPAQPSIFEPTLYCLYNGIPYSRGSRLYQGGFAMSCDLIPNNPSSLVWQLVR